MSSPVRRLSLVAAVMVAALVVLAGPAVVSASAFAPGDYDNTVNTTANNQTTGQYRDVIWWGKADPYEQDYINANPNLIATAGSPSRAVVGGDDFAINFTGQRSGGGLAGQSWITVFDTTPADKTAGSRSLVDFTVPGGVTLKADVLFASPGHNSSGGILAMYDEDAGDGLALLAQHGGGNNPDHARLSLVYQIAGTGTELESIDVGQLFEADTNPGTGPGQATGATSGDNWYRLVMNVSVTGANNDQVAVTGSFYNHTDPTDPSSAIGTLITDLAWNGTLGLGDLAGKSPATPGEVGLIAMTPESFSDGVANGWTGADPHTDNIGVSIIPESGPPPPVIKVKVEKTVNTFVARTWDWDIDKTVTPATWRLFKGDSGTSTYTVSVDKTGYHSSYMATGTITVTNQSTIPVLITSISDVVSPNQGANITPPVGFSLPYTLALDETLVFTYDVTLDDDTNQTNTATVKVGVLGQADKEFQATKPVDFTHAPISEVNGTVTITDTYGDTTLGVISDDEVFHYSRRFTCEDQGENPNTATIVETGQHDHALVDVKCYAIDVTKDAHTRFTRTYRWTIEKSVTPASWDFFAGDSGTSDYAVALTKDEGTDSSAVVTGTITVHNPAPIAATITNVSDYVSPMIGAALQGPTTPFVLGSGETTTFAYSADLADTTTRTNTATAELQNFDYDWLLNATMAGKTNFTGTSKVEFGDPATKVNDSVTLTDTIAGNLGKYSDDATVKYSRIFTCANAGDNPNRATIVETEQSDDATVTVKCWSLDIDKDGLGSFRRTFNWTINKSVTPNVWNFLNGGSGVSTYTVTLTKSAPIETGYAASGHIYINNPAPIPATINSVSDVIQVVNVPAVVSGTFPAIIPPNTTLTLDYVAPLASTATVTNMATYVQQHFHYAPNVAPTATGTSSDSAIAPIVFGGATTVANDTIHVTDTWKGSLGAFSSSSSVQYPRTFTCADVGNWPNTATITETGQQSSANVLVTCSSTIPIPGLSIDKTASPNCILSGTVVTYTYVVTNTGQTVLTNVVVTDDKLGSIGTIQVMNPGDKVTLTKTAPITDDVTNVGKATDGVLVATDPASVDVVHPAIDVEKTSDAPAEGVLKGTTVTYFYTVKNTGDVPLSNVNVTDDKLGTIATGVSLAVGETKSLPSKSAALDEATTNVVTATGVDSCNHQVSDQDSLIVDVFLPFTPPDIKLEKAAIGEEFSPGDLVSYTLTYTNIGDGPASNFTIVDDYDQRYMSVEDAGGGVDDGDKITWTIAGPVGPEEQGSVTYTMRLNSDFESGTTQVCNTAVATVTGDVDTSNNTASDCVSVSFVEPTPAPEEEEEEFLPFTGGELGLIVLVALIALAGGLALRRIGRTDA